jgi:hypothetical protein
MCRVVAIVCMSWLRYAAGEDIDDPDAADGEDAAAVQPAKHACLSVSCIACHVSSRRCHF